MSFKNNLKKLIEKKVLDIVEPTPCHYQLKYPDVPPFTIQHVTIKKNGLNDYQFLYQSDAISGFNRNINFTIEYWIRQKLLKKRKQIKRLKMRTRDKFLKNYYSKELELVNLLLL